jgi:ubiquinone/menaquinone biosynthesis C-methylase UbiE
MSTNAWTRYWSGGEARSGGGCLPDASGPIVAAQRREWQAFARKLPRAARVLDLATGNGVVCGWMVEARRDLKPMGVDSAAALPPGPRGVTLKAGVSIARLPFPDGRFHAATSQFGFEYCADPARSSELARVLAPGAPLLMIVHHSASSIVAHNSARREALRWAIETYVAKAVAFAATGLSTPPAFARAPAEAQRLFPAQPAAGELVVGMLQRLQARSPLAPLEAEARGEIERIAELEAAALAGDGVAALVAELAAAGFDMAVPAPLADPLSQLPLAWRVAGLRSRGTSL